ncbi:hypothetical protein [Ulvibacterium sp.]|uniref:hypothetical protein n=1 Tax=Ulvibacterium sp. TaxID=2665914 RepID=UPI003BA9DC8C
MKKKEEAIYYERSEGADNQFKKTNFDDNQLEYIKLFVSGCHPTEIQKNMNLTSAQLTNLKSNIRYKLDASNDFEMIKRVFTYGILKREDYVEKEIKDIALRKAAEIIHSGMIQNSKGVDLYAEVYNALLSFYHELEYDELLLKMDIKENRLAK